MGLKIVIPIGYQRVKRISLTAMPLGGVPEGQGGS